MLLKCVVVLDTIVDYLLLDYEQMLQMVATSLRSLGTHAMFYLAAAVSDFYVPWKSMVMVNMLNIAFLLFHPFGCIWYSAKKKKKKPLRGF